MDMQKKVEDLEQRVLKLESLIPNTTIISLQKNKKISAKEFLITKDIKTDVQKTLVLGYYLEYTEGMESFNTSDLEVIFRSSKEKLPKNINDSVNKNIARGFLDEAKEKKEGKKSWYLTSTGEKYVESELIKNIN